MDSKQEKFLKDLEKKYNKFKAFSIFGGPGLWKRIERLVFSPRVYLPYLVGRFALYSRGEKSAKLFFGRKIKCKINDQNAYMFGYLGALYGEPEYRLTKFFIRTLKGDDVFYDVGANYGFYSYLALEFCREVHSFEPLPTVFNNLTYNLSNDSNVFLNNLALSDTNGETLMYLSGDSGVSTINKDSLNAHAYVYRDYVKVRTVTLNEYLKYHKKPTVIKLDVEGSEGAVIDGGWDFFKHSAPVIAMEVWGKEDGGEISMKAVQKLRDLGYRSYYINFDGELEERNGDLSGSNSSDNYVFLRR